MTDDTDLARDVQPFTYRGKDVNDMTREELIEALRHLGALCIRRQQERIEERIQDFESFTDALEELHGRAR